MAQCTGNCGSCGGCGRSLSLTPGELHFLKTLGQIPFLPVARKTSDMIPIYLEDNAYTKDEYSMILQMLERKDLIDIDYGYPLSNYDMSAYDGYPVHGSIALTNRGQKVLDTLEVQGVQED